MFHSFRGVAGKSLLVVALALGGCASGTKYSSMSLPPVNSAQCRLFFYRPASPLGAAIQPDIKLNGEVVGKSQPGGFFFVDRPAGKYEVSTSTEAEHKLALVTAGGDIRYIRTSITMGLMVGQVWPELVGSDEAQNAIKDCAYNGPAIPEAKVSK